MCYTLHNIYFGIKPLETCDTHAALYSVMLIVPSDIAIMAILVQSS